MSRIKVYDTYTEIINGLFIDIPDEEFTFLPENLNIIPRVQRQVRVPDFDEAPFIIGTSPQGNYIVGFDPIDLPDIITVTRNPNEETSHQLRNMSEQELIQYFDRISQEEEN